MAIKHKAGGAYSDIVGVFHKASGVYSAVQGVFVKDGGAYQSVYSSWEPAVLLTGSAFTATQIEPGVVGAKNTTSNVNRIFLASSSGATLTGGSVWCGWIKATEAKIVVDNNSASYPNAVAVSVDGAAFVNAPNSGSQYTLFTGLADVEHFVVWRTGTIWGVNNIYLNRAGGNILTLVGASTYVAMCNNWCYPGVSDALSACDAMTKANTTDYVPNKSLYGIYTGVSNLGSARIRGAFKKIAVASVGAINFSAVYVSKNGAAPTKHTLPMTPGLGGAAHQITGLDGSVATYTVWTDHLNRALFSVSGDAAHLDVGAKKRIHQFGDSITYGNGGYGEVDVFRVAASMGYTAVTCGVGGQTVTQLDTAMDTYLAALTVTANDVAIIAIGRNNIGTFDAAAQTAYTSIINKCVTKGYGKIICRGILPSGDGVSTWNTENTIIAGLVTAVGNANVVFQSTSTCPNYTTTSSDNVHPDAAGYGVVAAYVEPLYRTILGL